MKHIIAVDKPVGPTSHDVVQRIRKITGIRKVGHAGTLDPLASGVLVVGIGPGTKALGQLMLQEKEYQAVICLGATSTTDDSEGVITQTKTVPPKRDSIDKTLKRFVGSIQQTPPVYSAVKVKGREAYKYARSGQEVTLKPRPVTIREIAVADYQWPHLTLTVRCGSGVYIRSLARDIGVALGTGGYLAALTRTRVGEYSLHETVTLEWISEHFND